MQASLLTKLTKTRKDVNIIRALQLFIKENNKGLSLKSNL